jgi:hypothetical protein
VFDHTAPAASAFDGALRFEAGGATPSRHFEIARPDGKLDHWAVSVEILETRGVQPGEEAALRRFALIYVVADERDVIRHRATFSARMVYLYRDRHTGDRAAALGERARRLNETGQMAGVLETLTNNCATNMVHPINPPAKWHRLRRPQAAARPFRTSSHSAKRLVIRFRTARLKDQAAGLHQSACRAQRRPREDFSPHCR